MCYVYIVICSGHYNKLLTYLLTYLLTPHNIPFWCVVLEVYRHTPTQNTSNTTYHCYVVLEVYRHTQHKIPPTRRTIGVSCWRFTDIHNTKYLQHDIPLLCRVGGLPTYTTQNTSNTTYHWCVVLEVYRHTQHKIPPTRHTIGVSCWRFTDIHQYKIPLTRHTLRVSCWRFTDMHQHKIPPTRRTIGVSCWMPTDIPNTKYLQHDIPLFCRVGGLPTYTTQHTSNTTYHWCVVYVVTFRPSYI